MTKKRIVHGDCDKKFGERFVWSVNQVRLEESLFCITHRFCALNLPNRQEFLKAIGLARDTSLSIQLLSGTFANRIGHKITEGRFSTAHKSQKTVKHFLEDLLCIENTKETLLNYRWLNNKDFFTTDFRYCSECLSNFAFHSIVFQCIGIEKCPVHNSNLLTKCPKCKCSISTILNGKNIKFNFICNNCRYPLVPHEVVVNPPTISMKSSNEIKRNRLYLQKLMKKNIFYLHTIHHGPKPQNYENKNIWSAVSYFASNRFKLNKIEFEKKQDLEIMIDCGSAFSLFKSIKLNDYYQDRLFTKVLESYSKETIRKCFNLNISNYENSRFCKDVIDLMRSTFRYCEVPNNFYKGKCISDLDNDLFDEVINLKEHRILLVEAVSISDNVFSLGHTIILKLVCYIAYLHGLFEECAEITRLTVGKRDEIKELAAEKFLSTATPQIIGMFDGPQLWLHVYYCPVNRVYLQDIVTKTEKEIAELFEVVQGLRI